jgi:hypothetical protein
MTDLRIVESKPLNTPPPTGDPNPGASSAGATRPAGSLSIIRSEPAASESESDAGFFVTLAKDLKDAPRHFMDFITGNPVEQSLETLRALTAARKQHQRRAKDAYDKGDYKEAFHQLMFSIPIIGPPAGAAADDIQAGKPGEGAAHAVEALAPWIAPELSVEGVARVGAAARGAATGAARAATETVPLTRLGVEVNLPKPLVTGSAAAAGARAVGLPATPAAVLGAAAPIVRGAVQGVKEALAARVARAVESLSPPEIAAGEPVEAFRGSKYEGAGQRFGAVPPEPTPGELYAREIGASWDSMRPEDRELLEHAAKARNNAKTQPVAPPSQPTAAAPLDPEPQSPQPRGKTIAELLHEELAAKHAAGPDLPAQNTPTSNPNGVATVPSGSAPRQAAAAAMKETDARAAKVRRLADVLHEHGVTAADVPQIKPEQLNQLARALGVGEPSATSVAQIAKELDHIEAAKKAPAVADKPDALSIAQQLRDSMIDSGTILPAK